MIMEIRAALVDKGYSVTMPVKEPDGSMNIAVGKSGFELSVWERNGLFGFDLVDGGTKRFEDFDKFMGFLEMYLTINSDYIPKCKIVASHFETCIGATTVYDKFIGNKNDGYIFIFSVVGSSSDEVRIKYISDDSITAAYAHYTEDRDKLLLTKEYKYRFVDGELIHVNNAYSVYDMLRIAHPAIQTAIYRDTDTSVLLFTHNGEEVNVGVVECAGNPVLTYEDRQYEIKDIETFSLNELLSLDTDEVDVIDDGFDSDDEFSEMRETAVEEESEFNEDEAEVNESETLDAGESEEEQDGVLESVIEEPESVDYAPVDTELVDSYNPLDDEAGFSESAVAEESTETIAGELEEDDEVTEESAVVEESTETITGEPEEDNGVTEEHEEEVKIAITVKSYDNADTVKASVLRDCNGDFISVDILTNEGLYRVSAELFDRLGIPLRVFVHTETMPERHGIFLTFLEREHKCFAIELTEESNFEYLRELFMNNLFE